MMNSTQQQEIRRLNINHKETFVARRTAVKGILLLSICLLVNAFMLCVFGHLAMLDFYVISEGISGAGHDHKRVFAGFILFDLSIVSNRFLSGASEILKGFLIFSFIVPWLCFLYKKYDLMKMKIAYALSLLYYILGGIFLVYIYYKLDIVAILPDLRYQLYHFMLLVFYLWFLMAFLSQIIFINNGCIGEKFNIKLILPIQIHILVLISLIYFKFQIF